MGPLTWQFELGELRARSYTPYGTYLVQGRRDRIWVAELLENEATVRSGMPRFLPTLHTSLADAMRACRNHAESQSEGSGLRRVETYAR